MNAISVHQPWSWAILHGGKPVENRSWRTHHRGPLLIHASRSKASYAAVRGIDWREVFGVELPPWDELPTGAVVGVVDLVDCVQLADWKVARAKGCILAAILEPVLRTPWTEGPWCWVLENPRPFAKPVPWSGSQGFFEVPDKTLPELK